MKITCKEDLKNVILRIDDEVVFNETVFKVKEDKSGVYLSPHESCAGHGKGIEKLNINLKEIARETLGYTHIESGVWPYAFFDDFKGVTNLVKSVYEELENKSEPKVTCKEDLENRVLKIGNKVVFNETVFEVYKNENGLFLESGADQCKNVKAINLNIKDLADKVYGYVYTDFGAWPYAKEDDFEGLTRLVRAVYIELEKVENKSSSKITCKEDLENRVLKIGDEVIFNETVFKVGVNAGGLLLGSGYNQFKNIENLKVDFENLSYKVYGYKATGFWPYAKEDDFEGLTRLVRAVYIELEK